MIDEEALSLLMNGVEQVCAAGMAWAKQASPEDFEAVVAALRSGAMRPRLVVDFEGNSIVRMIGIAPDGGEAVEIFRYTVRPIRPMDFN